MIKSIINVDGMSCEHCVKAVTNAVGSLPGVSSVTVDLVEKTVTVTHDISLPVKEIELAIEEQGYDIIS